MPLRSITVAYGRPALDAVQSQVAAAKAGDPLRPVVVLVPTHQVGVTVRRNLARNTGDLATGATGIAAIDVMTVKRLAELLGAPSMAIAGRRPISGPVLAAAARHVLLTQTESGYHRVREHPSTERSLVTAHRELSEISDEALDTLAQLGQRQAEVVGLHREMVRHLAPDWFDERALLDAATRALDTPVPLLAQVDRIILHLPQDLSQAAARFIRRLAESAEVVVIAGTTGNERADHRVEHSLRLLELELERLDVTPRRVDQMATATDADDEVRHVVRLAMDALASGTPADRIAVLHGAEEPYGRLLAEHFEAAGVPHQGGVARSLAESVAGRGLTSLLAVADQGLRREDVLDALSSAPVLDSHGRPTPTLAWERISRDAGVVSGDDWTTRLHRYATSQRQEAERGVEEGFSNARVERSRRNADLASRLSAFVVELTARVAALSELTDWRDLTSSVSVFLADHLTGEKGSATRAAAHGWPAEELQAAHRIQAIFDRLEGLAQVEPLTDLGVFRRTLDIELETPMSSSAPSGHGVSIGRVDSGLGLDVDELFVVGLAEGTLPGRTRDDSLLPDRDRRSVSSELALKADRSEDDHRLLLAVGLSCEGRMTWTMPRGDLRRSTERAPSRWLISAAAERAGHAISGAEGLRRLRAHEWCCEIPSFAAGVEGTAHPAMAATEQEFRLRTFRHLRPASVNHHPLVVNDERLARSVAAIEARRAGTFTRFDGNLGSGVIDPTGPDQIMSATRLQTFAACPLRYFFENELGVSQLEEPERVLQINALEKGRLVHEILDIFFTEILERPGGPPAFDEDWSDADRSRLHAIADEECARAEARGLTGKQVFWRIDATRVHGDLDGILDWDRAHSRTRKARVGFSELRFGLPGSAHPPLEVALTGGRTLKFRGAIDRVDLDDEGGIHLIDWKTGRYEKVKEDALEGGRKLQLPIYALAARSALGRPDAEVHSDYVYVSPRDGKGVRNGGYQVDDAVETELIATLSTMADLMARGAFPSHPDVGSTAPHQIRRICPACEPDGLGTTERRDQWEKNARDPRLEAYVRLSEPELADLLHPETEPEPDTGTSDARTSEPRPGGASR